MGYYDLDEILADSTRIPCKFNLTASGLAYLEGNPTHDDPLNNSIKKGTRIDLPLWLAEYLASTPIPQIYEDDPDDVAFIELIPPTYTSTTIFNALKSSPTTIQLNTILKNYYAFIQKWSSLFNDKELVNVITEVLKERIDEINNFAQVYKGTVTGASTGGGDFIGGLDEFEKQVFKSGNASVKQVKKWLRNEY